MKTCSCPKCGAEIPQKEFLNQRDKVVMPAPAAAFGKVKLQVK